MTKQWLTKTSCKSGSRETVGEHLDKHLGT